MNDVTIYNFGYLICLCLLYNLMWMLISTNSWTKGKVIVVLLVSILTWNFTWATLNIFVDNLGVYNTVRAYGFQLPAMIILTAVTILLRGGTYHDGDH